MGNEADLYGIEDRIDEVAEPPKDAGIPVDGLFCDLDAGFDGKNLRKALDSHGIISNVYPNRRNGGEVKEERLFDEEMYKERWKIELSVPDSEFFLKIMNFINKMLILHLKA